MANYTLLKQVCEAAGAEQQNDENFNSFKESMGEWNSKLHQHTLGDGTYISLSASGARSCLVGVSRAQPRNELKLFCYHRQPVVTSGHQRCHRPQRHGNTHLAAPLFSGKLLFFWEESAVTTARFICFTWSVTLHTHWF